MASHLAATGAPDAVDSAWWANLRGLVFLGYPLHPPGRPQQIRVSHLPHIVHPMLVVQGARDAFGSPAELRLFFDVLTAPAEVFAVEQAGHSLEVPKRSGLTQPQVNAAVQDRIVAWISERLGSASNGAPRPTR
jgi:predicted alpha/beta-hydrolase family hydrolase